MTQKDDNGNMKLYLGIDQKKDQNNNETFDSVNN